MLFDVVLKMRTAFAASEKSRRREKKNGYLGAMFGHPLANRKTLQTIGNSNENALQKKKRSGIIKSS